MRLYWKKRMLMRLFAGALLVIVLKLSYNSLSDNSFHTSGEGRFHGIVRRFLATGGFRDISSRFTNHEGFQDRHDDKFDINMYMSSPWDPWSESEQSLVDYMGEHLEVRYRVVTHLEKIQFRSLLSLRNTGSQPIPASGWSLYISHFELPELDVMYRKHWALIGEDKQFNLSHVDGPLYTMTPTDTYKPMEAGKTYYIYTDNGGCMLNKNGVYPNWYVTSSNTHPKILSSTRELDSFVGKFKERKQWYCNPLSENTSPWTPEVRYDRNRVLRNHGNELQPYVIPTPVSMDVGPHTLDLTQGTWVVVSDVTLQNEAEYLAKSLNINVKPSRPKSNFILLGLGRVDLPSMPDNKLELDESYSITTDHINAAIVITAPKPAGVFHAIQTLLSLYDNNRGVLPLVDIKDAPRFGYRGFMLDVSRNFVPVAEVLKIIDTMSMYKLNIFHFHLTDDQGWRLEIPGLEELTRIGSVRSHNYTKGLSLPPMVGSGPFRNNPGSGYYTVREYRRILRHARDRHIQVIPEVDSPGHGQAAMLSMEARYRRFKDVNMTAAREYRLTDPKDTSDYYAPQGLRYSTINICMNSTYRFMEHVMTAIKRMHQDIAPLKVFHLGGDEINKYSLSKSPECERFRKKLPDAYKTTSKLVQYYIWRVSEIASRLSLKLQMWADGTINDQGVPFHLSHFPIDSITANIYDTTVDSNRRMAKLVNKDYKVVLSKATDLYFDHPQEPDPEERGLIWATRYTTAQQTFAFLPEKIYDNRNIYSFNDPRRNDTPCTNLGRDNCIPVHKPNNIIGMQGHVWTETAPTTVALETLLYPRLLSLAERAWHRSPWEHVPEETLRERMALEEWEMFANVLGHRELARLERAGVMYYLPPPGAIVERGVLLANTAFPGLEVQISIDGGKTWTDLRHHHSNLNGTTVLLATRSHDMKRRGRVISIDVS